MISISSINKKAVRKLYGIAGVLITLVIPYFIMHFDHGHIETAQSYCPFKMLTGMPCPGCGITKSLVFLYEGNLYKSLYYHLFGPLTVLFCILAFLTLTAELITQKEYFNNILYSKKLAYSLAIFLGMYHLTRLVIFIYTHSFSDILHESIWG